MSLRHLSFCILLFLLALPGSLNQGCPSVCVCKWKNGKQTAECQGMAEVPTKLNKDTQVLDLSNNPLGTLPSRVFQDRSLVNLQKVFLAHCSLQYVAGDAFYQLSNLVELDLSRNHLEDVPSAIFSDTSQLRRLTLEGNRKILRLSANAFDNLTYLNVLDLSNCEIASIHPKAFKGLDKLEVLKLHGNSLTVISSDVLRTLPPLFAFSLQNNPWHCDCHLRDLRMWMSENNVPLGEPPKCESPASLQHQSWVNVPLERFACKPVIVTVVREFNVERFENVTLECRVQASPQAIIFWEIDGLALNETENADHLHLKSDSDYSLLTIDEVVETKSYLCVAENEAGNDTANFTVSMIFTPEVPAGWARDKVIWVGIGIFLAAVLVVLIVGCVVALRYRALTSNDGKFAGVGILKQLAAKKVDAVEVRADKANDVAADKVPRHETGSSGYGSDQHTPDLTNKAEMQNGPTYSTKAFLYSHPVQDSITKETYSIHEQGHPASAGTLLHRDNHHGYSNEFPDVAGYHDGFLDAQYAGSDKTLPPCDLVKDNRCRGSMTYSDCSPVRGGEPFAVPAVHVWKRTPLVGGPEFEIQATGDRRYSPDEGYAEETLEGTEV